MKPTILFFIYRWNKKNYHKNEIISEITSEKQYISDKRCHSKPS